MHHVKDRKVIVSISAYFVHPEYDANNDSPVNDIAIIRLEKPVIYTTRLKPICLAVDPKMYQPGTSARVTGWGAVSEDQTPSFLLRQADITVEENSKCRETLNKTILETAICAGGEEGKDACSGDSGGPMFVYDGALRAYQIGIISWGRSCGRKDTPAVYTRINSFIHWIRNITSDSPSCEMIIPPLLAPNVDNCGIPEKKSHSGSHILSWMAKIMYRGEFLGTGILINQTWVLTPNSVMDSWKKYDDYYNLQAIVGMRRVDSDEFDESELKTAVHSFIPRHDSSFVLLKLDLKLSDFSLLQHPVCMPDKNSKRRLGQTSSLMFWKEEKLNKTSGSTKEGKTENKYIEIPKKSAKNSGNNTKSNGLEKKRIGKPRNEHSKNSHLLKETKKFTLKHMKVKIIDSKRCKIPELIKHRAFCGLALGKEICHEKGAFLLKYAGGRFYMLGFVHPTTKKCSKKKVIIDISWEMSWIFKTTLTLRPIVVEP